MNLRSWQQQPEKNTLDESRILAAHFLYNGVLLTMRWRIPGRTNRDLINQETTFYATLEQAEDLANSILTHIRSQKPEPDSSRPADPVPGPP